MPWRLWLARGTNLGVVLVALSLVAATPSTPAAHLDPAGTSDSAPFTVPKITTTVVDSAAAPRGVNGHGDAVAGTPAPGTSTLTRSEPTRVRIPAIELDSELVALGLQDDGRMEVPPGPFPAGWYTGAPTPGELGPAILAGHIDHSGSAGVFYRLRELEPGDTVEVARQDGSTAVFRVTRVEQHRKDAFPTTAVYGDLDHAGLRLITCGGQFDHRVRSYQDNIVVFAELDIGAAGTADLPG